MTHVGQSSAVPGVRVSLPDQQNLQAGRGGQADALSPRPAGHSDSARSAGSESRRQLQARRASRRYYRRLAAERRRAGLTMRGQPRKYQDHTHRRQAFLAQGLTAQGRVRVRRISSIPTVQERAWRELRATMAIPTTDFLTPIER